MLRDIQTIKNIVKNETVNDNTWCLLGFQYNYIKPKSIKIPRNVKYIMISGGYYSVTSNRIYNDSYQAVGGYGLDELLTASFIGQLNSIHKNDWVSLQTLTYHNETNFEQKIMKKTPIYQPSTSKDYFITTCESYLVCDGYDNDYMYFHICAEASDNNPTFIMDNFIKITGFIEKKLHNYYAFLFNKLINKEVNILC